MLTFQQNLKKNIHQQDYLWLNLKFVALFRYSNVDDGGLPDPLCANRWLSVGWESSVSNLWYLPASLSLLTDFRFVLLWGDWWQVSHQSPCKISTFSTGKLLISSQVHFNFFLFLFFLMEDDAQNLCVMLATRHRIVMNYTTQVAEGRGKNLYFNLGYLIVAFFTSSCTACQEGIVAG